MSAPKRAKKDEGNPEIPKLFVDGNEMFLDSYKLARQVYDDGFRPTIIVGLWRGGTPIGIAVEEFFRVQGVESFHTAMKTESYSGIGQRREVTVKGLRDVIEVVNSEDQLLLVDDIFDSGKTVKTVIEEIKKLARKNTPTIKVACLYYKPKANKTDITPNYWLKETEDWVVFPHEVQGLTHDEISRKGPGFLELVKAPGGPHADE